MKSPKVWQVALKLDEQSFLLIPGHCSVKLTDRTTYSLAISIHQVYIHSNTPGFFGPYSERDNILIKPFPLLMKIILK